VLVVQLAAMPGNVFVPATTSGLARDSVVDVTGVVTLDDGASRNLAEGGRPREGDRPGMALGRDLRP